MPSQEKSWGNHVPFNIQHIIPNQDGPSKIPRIGIIISGKLCVKPLPRFLPTKKMSFAAYASILHVVRLSRWTKTISLFEDAFCGWTHGQRHNRNKFWRHVKETLPSPSTVVVKGLCQQSG
mmetsp:Transcript_53935/g.155753  ORF Transcript_53935/g.155753 Transcript_53935/m.155753 type:complete len:121 (+) Transcript_53935:306-668(+)